MESTRYSINRRDLGKGTLVAFGTAFFATLMQWLNMGTFPTGEQLKVSAVAGISAAVTYLLKNFFTDDIKTAENILQKVEEKAMKKQTTNFQKPAAPKDNSL